MIVLGLYFCTELRNSFILVPKRPSVFNSPFCAELRWFFLQLFKISYFILPNKIVPKISLFFIQTSNSNMGVKRKISWLESVVSFYLWKIRELDKNKFFALSYHSSLSSVCAFYLPNSPTKTVTFNAFWLGDISDLWTRVFGNVLTDAQHCARRCRRPLRTRGPR